MRYVVKVVYQGGTSRTWLLSDRETARHVIEMEMRRYGKLITNLIYKGERV